MSLLDGVEFRPVFILGEHRSGTTLLYKMLGLSGGFNIVTVYHLLRYDELLSRHLEHSEPAGKAELNAMFRSRGLDTRLIDNMPLDADMPEEYCMLLHQRTKTLKLQPRNLALFAEFCRKLQVTQVPELPLLLKNPWDFANFGYIHSVFPGAKFVFIHRHPLDVLSSQLKALRSNWNEGGNPYVEMLNETSAKLNRSKWFLPIMRRIGAPDAPGHLVRRFMLRMSERGREYFRRNIDRLPPESWTSVRYEEFCQHPKASIDQILDFVGTRPRTTVEYDSWIQKRARRWEPDVEGVQEQLCRKWNCGVEESAYSTGPTPAAASIPRTAQDISAHG